MNINTINTIEVSSICDNSCSYCPAKDQAKYRKVGFMSEETFKQAIYLVNKLCRLGTQLELNLFGVGEPTLHPRLVDMVKYARDQLPFRQILHLNTNGNTLTLELAQALKAAGISKMDVTGHSHSSTARAVRILRRIGIPFNVSYDFALYPNNWAGQVDWFEPEYDAGKCPWIGRGQVMVMSDGRVTTCCIDAFGKNCFGSVSDPDILNREVKPSHLCGRCHHTVEGVEYYEDTACATAR
jgi:hypothetical protein